MLKLRRIFRRNFDGIVTEVRHETHLRWNTVTIPNADEKVGHNIDKPDACHLKL